MSRQVARHRTSVRAKNGLVASNISHGYDGSAVLEDVTLEATPGEVLAVIGPSGTGKTTLLRLLAMFERPDAGVIRFEDVDIWSVAERERLALRRRMGMVFQQPTVFDATVDRNVRYGLHVRRSILDRLRSWYNRLLIGDRPGRVEEALTLVGLADETDQHARSLSGGEAQRLSFARAIAYEPDFLLLDEPTSELDPRNTAIIEAALDTARDDGLGVVLATHDMHQAQRIADRVAVMLDGQVIEIGPTDEIFSDARDPRVRRFIDGELIY